MKPSLLVTGKTCDIAAEKIKKAVPIHRLLHQRGSLISPKAASTLTAPSAHVSQCEAAFGLIKLPRWCTNLWIGTAFLIFAAAISQVFPVTNKDGFIHRF